MNILWYYKFPIGIIGIAEDDNGITNIFFDNDNNCIDKSNFILMETTLINKTANQLYEYFNHKRKIFDVPLSIHGTEFQNKVWLSLVKIPYGETKSYQDIAKNIGNEKACRAVGNANNKNPICIIIPCHRVIGKNMSLTGYAGGIHIKKYLLDLEKNINNK